MSTPTIDRQESYISAAEAIRQYANLNRTKLYHLAMTGRIKVQLLPGIPPRYDAASLSAAMNQGQPQ